MKKKIVLYLYCHNSKIPKKIYALNKNIKYWNKFTYMSVQ